MFRNLRMRWELRRGRALDIWSTGEYPSDVLSNLCSNRFRLDGISRKKTVSQAERLMMLGTSSPLRHQEQFASP